MHLQADHISRSLLTCLLVGCAGMAVAWGAGPVLSSTASSTNAVVVEIENVVEVLRAGASTWDLARNNQMLLPGDQVRTGERSRGVVRLPNQTALRLGELSVLQIPEPVSGQPFGLKVLRGLLYFFHRGKPDDLRLDMPSVSAVVRGTEFTVETSGSGETRLTMLDGQVQVRREGELLNLSAGETATVRPGELLAKSPALNLRRSVQWVLHYPAVLNLGDLSPGLDSIEPLTSSLMAYRKGNLLQALAKYPSARTPASNQERIYLAALLLSVGQVDRAQSELAPLLNASAGGAGDGTVRQLAAALARLISIVTGDNDPGAASPQLATEWLVESYRQQSQRDLAAARLAATEAIQLAPGFGFGWARLAELEFGFGRSTEAGAALSRARRQMPENAAAVSLSGFIAASQNRYVEALSLFDQALSFDGALGDAWLGRGLCRMHEGSIQAGLDDLQTAATLEPHRAVLRSYLAKGFYEFRDDERAGSEAALAKALDPEDPTAWLYSSLIRQQGNRINEAVRDLERSLELNNNRAVYRSAMLLDQDRAVRRANLATAFRDAGMPEAAQRTASQAVGQDYANYSAHLFLANSYDALRDPRLIEQRFETAAVSEYLVANLLAPVGAGNLSRTISLQEYSRMFERDGIHGVSQTRYLSRGDWLQDGAVYGTSGNLGFSVEASYRGENGQRVNEDLSQVNVSSAVKYQLTPQDGLYLQAVYFDSDAGDLARYYDPADANPALRVHEKQQPIMLAGYHHDWSPNSHTLVLFGRLVDDVSIDNPTEPVLLLGRNPANQVVLIATPSLPTAPLQATSSAEVFSTEVQQIWETERHSIVAGVVYQVGTFDFESQTGISTPALLGNATNTLPFAFTTIPTAQSYASDFERLGVYAYYGWTPVEPLTLTAGVIYDHGKSPPNFRSAPLPASKDEFDEVSPKIGLIWHLDERSTFRSHYTKSIGGVGIEQSFRLEPTQVGGFNQAFRSLMPESVVGAINNASFETVAAGIERRFESGTYLGIEGQYLWSEADRQLGAFDQATTFPFAMQVSATPEELRFSERSLLVDLNQLIGEQFSVGVRYRLTDTRLHSRYPEIPLSVSAAADTSVAATLNQADIYLLFHHPAGFFGGIDALWTLQDNRGYAPNLPGDDFWQFNAFVGYRFAQRRAEIVAGVLNIGDQDYRLNPLNPAQNLARERTATLSLRLAF